VRCRAMTGLRTKPIGLLVDSGITCIAIVSILTICWLHLVLETVPG
jgi:hypothetical protein